MVNDYFRNADDTWTNTVDDEWYLTESHSYTVGLDSFVQKLNNLNSVSLNTLLRNTGITNVNSFEALLKRLSRTNSNNLDAIIKMTNYLVPQLDAVLSGGFPLNSCDDITLYSTVGGTGAYLDALMQVVDITSLISTDAKLLESFPISLSLGSLLQIARSQTTDVDSLIQRITVVELSSLDSLIKKLELSENVSFDSLIKELGNTDTISLDSLIKKLNQYITGNKIELDSMLFKFWGKTKVYLDSLLKTTSITSNNSLDSLLKNTDLSIIVSIDALLQQLNIQSNISIDSLLKSLNIGITTSFDAYILSTGAKIQPTTLDSLLQDANVTFICNLNTLLQKANSSTTSTDVLLSKEIIAGLFLDVATLIQNQTSNSVIDSLLNQLGQTFLISLDGILEPPTKIQIDALLRFFGSATTGFNSFIQQTALINTISLDSYLYKTITNTIDIDSLIKKLNNTIDVNVDARLLKKIRPTRYSIDSKKRDRSFVGKRRSVSLTGKKRTVSLS